MKQEVLIRRCETNEDFEIAKTITHDYMIWLGMDLGFQNTDKEFAVFNRMYGEALRCLYLCSHKWRCSWRCRFSET